MSLDEIRKASGLGPLRCAECRAFGGGPEVECAHDGTVKCSRWGGGPVNDKPRKDAASADLGVEERHRRAHEMLALYPQGRPLLDIIRAGLETKRACCLDSDEELEEVAQAVLASILISPDARFLRALLGEDPANRMTRMHAHGALLARVTDAAYRLAGG